MNLLRSRILLSLPVKTILNISRIPTANEIRKAEVDALHRVRQMGLRVRPASIPSLLDRRIDEAREHGVDASQLKGSTGVFEVKKDVVLSPRRKSIDESFLLHPDLGDQLEALRSMGCKLVMDSSLPLLGTQGYTDVDNGVIGLAPSAKWHTFLHERYHVWFAKNVIEPIGGLSVVRQHRKRVMLS